MWSCHDEPKDLLRDIDVKCFTGGRPQSPWHDPGKHEHKLVRKNVSHDLQHGVAM